jgi:hypothetical protein
MMDLTKLPAPKPIDEKAIELARFYLPDAPEDLREELARKILQTVEEFMQPFIEGE